jgi:hypothetical protein
MWDGDILAGPVPTLFAEDADLSSEALAGDPAKAHGDLAKLYRAFFMPEHLQLADAVELLRKPRAGAALFSFRRGKYSVPEAPTSPAPKRRRPDEDEETGNPSSFRFPLSSKHQHFTVYWLPFSLAKVHLPPPLPRARGGTVHKEVFLLGKQTFQQSVGFMPGTGFLTIAWSHILFLYLEQARMCFKLL